jgi:NhaA family Na+:H+ antiporter
VLLGLVVGKLAGITTFTWLAVKLRIGLLPDGANWRAVTGIAALAGIGFTVSIFVTNLAFDDPSLRDEALIAILAAAVISSAVGAVILSRARPPTVTDTGLEPAEVTTVD